MKYTLSIEGTMEDGIKEEILMYMHIYHLYSALNEVDELLRAEIKYKEHPDKYIDFFENLRRIINNATSHME